MRKPSDRERTSSNANRCKVSDRWEGTRVPGDASLPRKNERICSAKERDRHILSVSGLRILLRSPHPRIRRRYAWDVLREGSLRCSLSSESTHSWSPRRREMHTRGVNALIGTKSYLTVRVRKYTPRTTATSTKTATGGSAICRRDSRGEGIVILP